MPRPRTPTRLKVLKGTDRPDRVNANEPMPDPIAPTPPPGLDHFGKQAWERLSPMLERLGLLTEADAEMLWAFCQTWSQLRKSARELNKLSPADDNYRRVAVTVENARKDLRLIGSEF